MTTTSSPRLHRSAPLALAGCLAAITLIGCTVGPNYAAPETPTPAGWGEIDQAVTTTTAPTTTPATLPSPRPPVVRWWQTFNDPSLDGLIARAADSNLDLRRARARVFEARARRDVARADRLFGIDVGGSYTHSRSPSDSFGPVTGGTGGAGGTGGGGTGGGTGTGTGGFGGGFSSEGNFYQAGFDASWELDVFGGVRRNVEAADADLAAAVEDQRDTLVSLLAEVARNYVDLRGFQRQAAIARENLAAQRETVTLTQNRLAAGVASDLEVAQAQAQAATTASTIPTLEAGARGAIHRLGVLLGTDPLALSGELSAFGPIPQPPPEIPVGLPSEILRRRPDLRRAERELAAATARVGVATADLYPRFSLTGSLGLQSSRTSELFNYSSRYWSVGPSVSWPLFDAGRIRANVRVENARQEQALLAYRQAVLTALGEVEDALVNYAKEESRRRTLVEAANANARAVRLATQLYAGGRTDFLSVLQAQRDLFATQDALVQSDRTVTTNLVALYKALGGGWQPD
jgi:NodT family efflux transporter outer membrane factor (OMF) lipoprotein